MGVEREEPSKVMCREHGNYRLFALNRLLKIDLMLSSTFPYIVTIYESENIGGYLLAFDILTSSIRNVGAGLELALPWKHPIKELPNNRAGALQRLKSMEKRLLKDPKIAERYVIAIEKYVCDGHDCLLLRTEVEAPMGRVWYLPHHTSSIGINPTRLG